MSLFRRLGEKLSRTCEQGYLPEFYGSLGDVCDDIVSAGHGGGADLRDTIFYHDEFNDRFSYRSVGPLVSVSWTGGIGSGSSFPMDLLDFGVSKLFAATFDLDSNPPWELVACIDPNDTGAISDAVFSELSRGPIPDAIWVSRFVHRSIVFDALKSGLDQGDFADWAVMANRMSRHPMAKVRSIDDPTDRDELLNAYLDVALTR